jgi:hypothetical protein
MIAHVVHLEEETEPLHVDKEELEVELRNALNSLGTVEGAPRGLELLVPRYEVVAAISTETAYSEMPEPLTVVLLKCQHADVYAGAIKSQLQDPNSQVNRSQWSIGPDDLLRFEGAVYVPPDQALKQEILKTNHDDTQGGHFGVKRTHDAVARKYYWRHLYADVEYYCRTCQVCQHEATPRHKEYGLMKPLPKPTQPFEIVTLDFIPKLPKSKWMGKIYDTILVMVDPLTKYVIYVPTIEKLNAEDFATVIYDTLIKYFTVPRHIVSDRAQLFTSPFWQTLCFHLGTKRRLSTAFHPRTDGQTERQNQTLEHYLRCYCNFEQDNWAGLLSMAQRVYNDSKHSVTGVSPTEALMGFRGEMRINVDDLPKAYFKEDEGRQAKANRELATNYAHLAKEKRTMLQEVLRQASETQAKYFNQKRMDMQFKIGEWVMLRTKNITPPEGIVVNDNIEYEVEEIRMEKRVGKGKAYLVKWKGYPEEECTWEPEEHVADTAAMDRYLEKPKSVQRNAKRRKQN